MGFIGDILGGKTSSTSTPILSPQQQQLVEQQLQLGEFQLEEIERQRRLQTASLVGVGASARSFEQATADFTGEATPEQQALIDEAYGFSLEQGQSDILAFQTQATEQLREELAPTLGLMPGDTPVLDRGSRIAAESARQQGQLVSSLGAQRATSSLEYPLQAQAFQAQLKEQAFQNRLQLVGQQQSVGLGLAGVSSPNAGAVLANQGGLQKGKNPAGGFEAVVGGIGGLLTGIGDLS